MGAGRHFAGKAVALQMAYGGGDPMLRPYRAGCAQILLPGKARSPTIVLITSIIIG